MAVRKLKPSDVSPLELVRERQVEDRVARAPMRELAKSWVDAARAWSRSRGLELRGVLDTFDHVASLYFYFGDSWEAAQARAWSDTMEILCPTR